MVRPRSLIQYGCRELLTNAFVGPGYGGDTCKLHPPQCDTRKELDESSEDGFGFIGRRRSK